MSEITLPLHGHEHDPVLGRDPIASAQGFGRPDLILSGGATTAPDGTTMPVPFIDVAYPPATLVPDHYVLDITDDGDTGNDRYEVTSVRAGWYAAELITQWDQVSTGGTEEFGNVWQRITWTLLTGFAFDPTQFRDAADWMDADLHPIFEFAGSSYLRTWMAPHYVPANRVWQMQAEQNTGVDRGLSGIAMKFWFLGTDDLSSWTFDTV